MSPDPSQRLQQCIDFEASEWYPGLVTLITSTGSVNATETEFSLPDLAVLRAKIDELLGTPPCPPCADGRHMDCPQHYPGSENDPCGCDNRNVHAHIRAEQVTAYRLARGAR